MCARLTLNVSPTPQFDALVSRRGGELASFLLLFPYSRTSTSNKAQHCTASPEGEGGSEGGGSGEQRGGGSASCSFVPPAVATGCSLALAPDEGRAPACLRRREEEEA